LTETLVRFDLPIRLGDDVGAVLDANVGAIDENWHLARLDFLGGCLWTRNRGVSIGRRVRVRVLARDVSLARQQPVQTSIQNLLRGQVDAIADDEHPGLALVRVRIGDTSLVARLTKRAANDLGLSVCQDVWVQVKSVALME
jgi:molybdate transport system ATP-binding protein